MRSRVLRQTERLSVDRRFWVSACIIPENQALEDLKSNNNQQGQYGKAPASAVQQPAYQGNTNSLIDANIGLSEKDLANQSLFNM